MTVPRDQPREPIARRLLGRLGMIGVLLALGISALWVLVDYQVSRKNTFLIFDQIEAGYLSSVTETVWLQDQERLVQLLDGIRQFPNIQLAEVRDESGGILASIGDRSKGGELARSFELRRSYLGRTLTIGQLTISADLAQIRLAAIERAWVALLANVAMIAGVLAALYWQVHLVVTRPLSRMAAYARTQGDVRSDRMVPLTLPATARNDELYDLAAAYTELHLATRSAYLQVRDSEARLRILFDNSPVSLWEEDFSEVKQRLDALKQGIGTDLDGYLSRNPGKLMELASLVRVIDVNAATLALHGATTREDLLGNLIQTFTPGSLDAFKRELLAIQAGEAMVEVEGEVQTLGGARRQVVVHWAVPPGHGETLDRVIVALEDVTERKDAERRAAETVQQLLRANAELARITEITSHDLQEPVRSVVSFSQLLERRLGDSLDHESRELLGYLMAAARRMREQAQGLLDYSRIATSDATMAPVALDDILEDAVGSLAEMVRDNRAVLSVEPLPMITGDRVLLRDLFRHLLVNAMKFTLPGIPPKVRVSTEIDPEGAHVVISDSGIGIAPVYARDVFDIFRKLHGPEQYPGAGVGLAICRKIVDRHGGAIWVDQERRDGCSIHVRFPRGA